MLINQKVPKCLLQKRPEPPTLRIRPPHHVATDHDLRQELLRQIARIVPAVPLATDERVHRGPVRPEQLLQRVPIAPRPKDKRPQCGLKAGCGMARLHNST